MRAPRGVGGLLSLADAGTASVATFLAGLIALRALDDDRLALYALVFAALTALTIAPQYMVYIPQRLHANLHAEPRRTDLRADLRAAAPLWAITAVGVVIAGLPLSGVVDDRAAFAALCGTAAVLTGLSPLQDHVRASLHVVGRHGGAAAVSAVNLATVAVVFTAVLVGGGGDADAGGGGAAGAGVALVALAPFGALVAGNLASVVVGVWLLRDVTVVEDREDVPVPRAMLIASTGFSRHGAGYVTNLLVAALLSPAALAGLEAARVAAQPVLILGTGVASAMMPRAVRAIGAGDHRRAARVMRRMVAVVSGTGATYALALLPLAPLLAVVFGRPVDAGLASARAGAYALSAAANPFNAYNMAERRYGLALGLTLGSELPALAVLVALLPSLGVFAVPVAGAVSALLRIALNLVARARRERRQ